MEHDGYFSPDDAIWRIAREAVLMLGGGYALLMQAAHPLVAAGIVEHSDFRREPFHRLARTMNAIYTVAYGTRADADRVAARVRAIHTSVRGSVAGGRYRALDPELLLWVHGTLVDTALVMYSTFVRPLGPGEQEAFYEDMKTVARVFGTPESVIPETLADFSAYKRERLESGEIAVTDAAREVAAVVLGVQVPLSLRPAFAALNVLTVALLPPVVREGYGLDFGVRHTALLPASATLARRALPLVPDILRATALARRAERRRPLPFDPLVALAATTR